MITYEYLLELLNGNSVVTGTNQDGEDVVITLDASGDYVKVETLQSNDRVRINYYWKDGTVEETYESFGDGSQLVTL